MWMKVAFQFQFGCSFQTFILPTDKTVNTHRQSLTTDWEKSYRRRLDRQTKELDWEMDVKHRQTESSTRVWQLARAGVREPEFLPAEQQYRALFTVPVITFLQSHTAQRRSGQQPWSLARICLTIQSAHGPANNPVMLPKCHSSLSGGLSLT